MKKKSLLTLLILFVVPSVIYASEPSIVLKPQSPNEQQMTNRQKQFAMGHIGVALYPDFSFGATYGQVDVYGWYANIMTDFGFRFSSDAKADENGAINGEYPFYTGKKRTSYFALTGGGVVRTEIPSYRIPIFLMAGIGYGNRTVRYEMADGDWATWKSKSSPRSGLHWELQAMTDYNDMAFSIGVSSVTNFKQSNFFELKLGFGYFL
ncbi:MAG: hypothetical protein IKO90_09410 [Bacteroidales bacterium]|nr:hypothetical protein [Bacteroidales bacterium]MBQ3677028.1 hypothetical protein [Bacteroidales bacterium]MBR4690664.1 hypothetical protein [Bacteroidales bacterium]MBR7035678.1 hypothetical protein [Bacteroidales bacterium]